MMKTSLALTLLILWIGVSAQNVEVEGKMILMLTVQFRSAAHLVGIICWLSLLISFNPLS